MAEYKTTYLLKIVENIDGIFDYNEWNINSIPLNDKAVSKNDAIILGYSFLVHPAYFFSKISCFALDKGAYKSSQQDNTTNFKNLFKSYVEWLLIKSPIFNYDISLYYKEIQKDEYKIQKDDGEFVWTNQNPIPDNWTIIDSKGNKLETKENLTLKKHNLILRKYDEFFDQYKMRESKSAFTLEDTVILAEGMMNRFGTLICRDKDYNGKVWDAGIDGKMVQALDILNQLNARSQDISDSVDNIQDDIASLCSGNPNAERMPIWK